MNVPLCLNGEKGEVIVQRSPNTEAVPPRLAQVLVELMIDQTTLNRTPNQHDLKDRFIYDLLHSSIGDEAAAMRQARILGMDFSPPRAVILIDASEFILGDSDSAPAKPSDVEIRRRAQLIIGSVVGFFMLPDDTICGYMGDGEVAVLKASNTKNLASWADTASELDGSNPSWANLTALKRASGALLKRLRADTRASLSIGIGRYHAGVHGLPASYKDATAALSLGRRFHGQNRVHCLDDLGVAAFVGVSDEQTKMDLATHLLSPLDPWPDLLHTIDVFFQENCCSTSAAVKLSIHRNTLSYRFDKVASLTGLDPRQFDDAIQIRLALAVRSLQPDRD